MMTPTAVAVQPHCSPRSDEPGPSVVPRGRELGGNYSAITATVLPATVDVERDAVDERRLLADQVDGRDGLRCPGAPAVHPIGPTTVDDRLAREHPNDGSRLELILGYLHVSASLTGQHQHAAFVLARAIEDALRVEHPNRAGTKVAAYAGADVPHFWEVNQDRVTVNAAPVPVTFDPAVLHP